MTAKKQSTRVRREQIARAALALVGTQGLRGLTLAAVAHRVGLVPSAVYRHFAGKDEIIDAALALIQEGLLEFVRSVREETSDAVSRLDKLLMRHVRMISENRGIVQIVFSQDFGDGHADRRARLYRGVCRYLKEVSGIIREGQAVGRIARDVDPDAAAVLFLGLVHPPALLWQMSEGEFDVAHQARRAWPLFARAIENASFFAGGYGG